jgi:uncharacterized protein YbbC (DUF1343 family)
VIPLTGDMPRPRRVAWGGGSLRQILTGLDRILRDGVALPGKGRVVLLCNATTVSAGWRPTAEALGALTGVRLLRILAPQHGFAAEKQDNMIASASGTHPQLGIPIISLYGDRREARGDDLSGADALLIDLPDVGTRVYTFLNTALLTMRAAAGIGLPVFILDRPNPIGGACEGPVLEDGCHSFVGMLDVPLRHGLTAGEFLTYGAVRLGLPAAGQGFPQVVRLEGWHRSLYFDETGLPWTMPSPNLPTLEAALLYPGQVVLEGTNVSEGRGTTRPFELCGAPYLDPPAVCAALEEIGLLQDGEPLGGSPLEGIRLRQVAYEPTFQKYAGELVRGFQLHIDDRRRLTPVAASTALLWAVQRTHPDAFAWRPPPYEYEWERPAIDLIYGTPTVREGLARGDDPLEIMAPWKIGLVDYRERIRPFLLYNE